MSDWKVMMIVAFHKNEVLGYQILPRNTNVDNNVYVRFLDAVVLRGVWRKDIIHPIILHDNARPHKHLNVKNFFTLNQWEELEHPAYSPDMNPCDFDGIARIKRPNKGRRFANEAALLTAYDAVVNEINTNQAATGIQHLPQRWEQIIKNEGDYVTEHPDQSSEDQDQSSEDQDQSSENQDQSSEHHQSSRHDELKR
jgi:[histone H3]-lysine36 N-dimethyltransferase SETMAR